MKVGGRTDVGNTLIEMEKLSKVTPRSSTWFARGTDVYGKVDGSACLYIT